MQYCYMILYAYEKGYGSTNIVFDKKIIDYQDIKEIEWKIRKKLKVHAHILNYKLIKKLPKKESRFDTMETFEYLEYLRNVVNKWRKNMKYYRLVGVCKDCLGCMRLEDPKFKGVYKCRWNEKK